jgi:hypothetical protein
VLAYLFVEGTNVNVEMVRQGWSPFWTKYGRGRYAADFEAAERGSPGLASSREPRLQRTQAACGSKRTCSAMVSCEEALFYLRECGATRLDGDGDGVPCESLCR